MHKQFPLRQIHLDFHTSEKIFGIGKNFDKKQFQKMLKTGHVNSITLFAKCHHGWCYYPARHGRMHPNLKFDLLKAQLEAVHEIGVNAPVYISAGVDEQMVAGHHHWLRRYADNTTTWPKTILEPGYHEFCMNSPYLDYLIAQTEEVVRNYDCDGIFLDIVGVKTCVCQFCIKLMLDRKQDPRDPEAQMVMAREAYLKYARRINKAIRMIKPHLRIFHNAGHITRGDYELVRLNTHIEMESLPTGGWGYDHFPLSVRYCQGLGMDMLGMTGKFHTSWGEFGGYKNARALKYEASLAIANGAGCSIGDQLHPYGHLDEATYSIIGQAYAEVEKKEQWCKNVSSVADIGVLSYEAFLTQSRSGGVIDSGVIRILLEGKFLFDVLDPESDFKKYRVLILPDAITINAKLKNKLKAYLKKGGKILLTGTSGLDTKNIFFAVNAGARYLGTGISNPSYIAPRFKLRDFPPAQFVMYSGGNKISASAGTEVLAWRQDSFFNRDYFHFSSHQHAPSTLKNAGPAIVRKGNVCYIAYPVFTLYAEKGQQIVRDITVHCLNTLLGTRILETSLPSQGINTLMHQKANKKYVLHLLYASPVKRGQSIEVIDDIVPLYNVSVKLGLKEKIRSVRLVPQGQELEFCENNGVVEITVPEVNCHQMVELNY